MAIYNTTRSRKKKKKKERKEPNRRKTHKTTPKHNIYEDHTTEDCLANPLSPVRNFLGRTKGFKTHLLFTLAFPKT